MRPEHETDDTLNAWLDHELTSRESAIVGVHVAQCTSCATKLAECRETRATVSMLLRAYDGTMESAPSTRRMTRRGLEPSRPAAVPIISHIVANSHPVNLWSSAKQMLPVAAAAALFVGSATVAIMRNYEVLTGSVNSVASTAQTPFVEVRGTITHSNGRPIANASIWVEGSKSIVHSDANGNFQMPNVPRGTRNIHARSIGFAEAVVPFVPEKASAVMVTLTPSVLKLDAVVIGTDSVSAPPSKR